MHKVKIEYVCKITQLLFIQYITVKSISEIYTKFPENEYEIIDWVIYE